MRYAPRIRTVIGWVALAAFACALLWACWPIITAKSFPAAPASAGPPGPTRWYGELYRLEDGEFVRFIPPPYLPERRKVLLRGWPSAPPTKNGTLGFYYGPRLRQWSMSSGTGTLAYSVAECGILSQAQVDIQKDLAMLPVDGDWVVRDGASPQQRLAALAPILTHLVHRDIRITRQIRLEQVIVARGSWAFQPLPGFSGSSDVQLFAGAPLAGGAGGGSGPIGELFKRLEDVTRRRVIDKTDFTPSSVSWINHHTLQGVDSDPNKLHDMLDKVSRQTSLSLTLEEQPIEVFVVRETPR